MEMKFDAETGILTIGDKYEIRPLMSIEEVQNSNLKELMNEEDREWLIKRPSHPTFIRVDVDGQKVSIELVVIKFLTAIKIRVNSAKMSEAYRKNDMHTLNEVSAENSIFMSNLIPLNSKEEEEEYGDRHTYNWGDVSFRGSNRSFNVETEVFYYR